MRRLVGLGVILAATAIAYFAPGMMPVWLVAELNRLHGKVFCGLASFFLVLDLAFAAYVHWHVPDNRKAFWTGIKVFFGLIMIATAGPPSWAIFQKLKLRASWREILLDVKSAAPKLPWESVALDGIFAVCILVLYLMLSREKETATAQVPRRRDEDVEWQPIDDWARDARQ